LDTAAILEFDPAAKSLIEFINAYPDFYTAAVYRITFELAHLNISYLPRIIEEYAHSKTGIDINLSAQIGKSFFIDQATGVLIGETTIIRDSVIVVQVLTLGVL
jgi:serine O-acetyltransferase